MKKKRIVIGMVSLVSAIILSACGSDNEEMSTGENMHMDTNTEENMEMDHSDMDGSEMDHSDMDHSSSGEVPNNLREAENPTFEVGSQAIIERGHMEGMEGAEATIVGAYDTTAYAVSYTPTTGGERIENHKWVIHEELIDPGEETLEPGWEVTLDADHMEGMQGVTAEIDSAEQTTVYMIDFTLTTSGEEIKNHKWVTESELLALAHH
ncbi:YdhK family protein [Halalkalibacter nanhaiisediminis]|uniref:Uncharacterized protein DUF1541 n=1 Tax=Halalkalibacter nanhaiisediminis TaxID=688079 RepID=A0A562QS32_9BACI|nr:YdhK family protein [Halalkalibacter nanhaiisediminis]TWI59000.1 uncharacterized protein DUF1541 [Halalkalibacter nanhaiisediminis]